MIDENIMYSEVYEILTILGPEYIDKIPLQLYEYIKNMRKKDYSCNINNYEPIESQNLMNETIEFISFINLKYWVNEKERKSLISIYNENEKIFKEKSREKYAINDIFKKNKVIEPEKIDSTIKEEKWYERLFLFFKVIFKK